MVCAPGISQSSMVPDRAWRRSPAESKRNCPIPFWVTLYHCFLLHLFNYLFISLSRVCVWGGSGQDTSVARGQSLGVTFFLSTCGSPVIRFRGSRYRYLNHLNLSVSTSGSPSPLSLPFLSVGFDVFCSPGWPPTCSVSKAGPVPLIFKSPHA